MTVPRPTRTQLDDIARGLGMHLSPEQLADYEAVIAEQCLLYDELDAMPDWQPELGRPATTAYAYPSATDDPLGAWHVTTSIRSTDDGPLAGDTIAIKDNICVAGTPMTAGSATMVDPATGEGFIPSIDATVVRRVLDAGATVAGKAVCENFCFSGNSHTSTTGPVRNPHRRTHSAGGSSSGCAALVASGQVDMAIGGDDGGSVRIPASFTGIYGMKPTWGLVPCTGVMPMENTIDHVGPMTATVADNARLLEVIAGPDGLDHRQDSQRTSQPYSELMGRGVEGMTIAVVTEGFAWPRSDPAVDEAVRAAAARFTEFGATVTEVSIPMHRASAAVWVPIGVEGAIQQTFKDNGHGFHWKGAYVTDMIDRQAQWRHRADELAEPTKLTMVLGEYFIQHHHGRFYAKAQNLTHRLRQAYDDVLADHDLIVMPTTPTTAQPLPDPGAGPAEVIAFAFSPLLNTCAFDVTGHPAMSVPCGWVDGLPVGMQIVGRHDEEVTIYRAAHRLEQLGLHRRPDPTPEVDQAPVLLGDPATTEVTS